MNTSNINPDLQKERDGASFSSQDLADYLHGGTQANNERKKILRQLFSHPAFDYSDGHLYGGDALGKFERAMQKAAALQQLKARHEWTPHEMALARNVVEFETGLALQYVMFIPTIERLGSDVQQNRWLPRAHKMEIVGAYAQTELGHGTFVRGLETEARYDPTTQEFVLNTPSPTGIKWWPGGLNQGSNHAVVMAQLYTGGRHCGLQAFIVQTRSLVDHTHLPGIDTGSIGCTMGTAVADNGYMRLTNVRIPRENMLMRFNEVTSDGKYIMKGAERSSYDIMVEARAAICGAAFDALKAAVTIAIRYAAVRRQSELLPGKGESQVLDYQTQQHKLFPHLAAAYAMNFVRHFINSKLDVVRKQMDGGNFTQMSQLHVVSAGLKAYITDMAAEGCEMVRRACGGHGYLMSGGGQAFAMTASALVTVEGENTVMFMQTARYLMRTREIPHDQLPSELTAILCQTPGLVCSGTPVAPSNYTHICNAFRKRAHYQLKVGWNNISKCIEAGKSPTEAWNMNTVIAMQAAQAYLETMVVEAFIEGVKSSSLADSAQAAMNKLCQLFAVTRILSGAAHFLMAGAMSADQIESLQLEQTRLCTSIRPDAVALVDAFDLSDHELYCSTLGRYDGQVYQSLIDTAAKHPHNQHLVNPAFEKYFLPIMKGAKL